VIYRARPKECGCEVGRFFAHSLRLKVVAEGVETEEQLGWLRDNGCDVVRSYYFSRPVTSDVLLPWLRVGGKPVSAGKKTITRPK